MKYLKTFKEAVIHPPKLGNDFQINSFEDLVEYGNQNEFDVVDYDNFYSSLTEADKRNAPPKFGVPFFALFHPENKKPMFVLADRNAVRRIPNFKTIVDDIIGHELVHAEQSKRKGDIEYSLPSPTDRKNYFSNKEEIMAFSWTIANEISKGSDFNTAIEKFRNSTFKGQAKMLWSDIRRVCDEDVVKRYRKYIYMYLDEMYEEK